MRLKEGNGRWQGGRRGGIDGRWAEVRERELMGEAIGRIKGQERYTGVCRKRGRHR